MKEMAELQTLSAVLGIVKNTWHAIEFIQDTKHAHKTATSLLERTNILNSLLRDNDLDILGHNAPLNEHVVSTVQNALTASNETLAELTRICRPLTDNDGPRRASRLWRSFRFTLISKNIQRCEQQLQTNIMSVQLALQLVDRGGKEDLTRRVTGLVNIIEEAMAGPTSSTLGNLPAVDGSQCPFPQVVYSSGDQTGLEDEEQSEFSSAVLKAIDRCIDAAQGTIPTPVSISLFSPRLEPSTKYDISISSPIDSVWTEVSDQASASDETGHIAGNEGLEQQDEAELLGASRSTELIDAIMQHHPDKFQRLLDNGVEVNGKDCLGYTPLMLTAYQHGKSCGECLECMHRLLQHNANVNMDNNGFTALHIAVKYKHLEAARTLLKNGANVNASQPNTPLMFAVQCDQDVFVELLLTYRPDLGIVDEDGWGLIHHAIWKNCKDALRLLLESNRISGLGLNLDARCEMGSTALKHLAERADLLESLALAEMLLKYGADVNATDSRGCPALFYAITGPFTRKKNEFVRLLLKYGAHTELVRRKASTQIAKFPAFEQTANTTRRDSAISTSGIGSGNGGTRRASRSQVAGSG